jgi:hypothetical protein
VKKVLEQRRGILERRSAASRNPSRDSGGWSSQAVRSTSPAERRFPAKKDAVRDRIAGKLAEWKVGGRSGHLAQRAQHAVRRAMPIEARRSGCCSPSPKMSSWSSPAPDGSNWESRFFDLRSSERQDIPAAERLNMPKGTSPSLATTCGWSTRRGGDPKNLYALLVWDENRPATAQARLRRSRQLGGRTAVINPRPATWICASSWATGSQWLCDIPKPAMRRDGFKSPGRAWFGSEGRARVGSLTRAARASQRSPATPIGRVSKSLMNHDDDREPPGSMTSAQKRRR